MMDVTYEDNILLARRQGDSRNYNTVYYDGTPQSNQAYYYGTNWNSHENPAFVSQDEVGIEAASPPAQATAPSQSSSYDDHSQHRAAREEELLFRLKFAHLSPGIDWFQEISITSQANQNSRVYQHVLATLTEYPLNIRDKIILARKIRESQYISSLTNSSSPLGGNQQVTSTDTTAKNKHPRRWTSGMSVPFGLWEGNIGRIAAYFGSHVASYFQFLRFLVLLNVGIGLIMFVFVSLPQIVPKEVWTDDVQAGFFGDLSHTIFFYGAYLNSSVTISGLDLSYNRPLAYLVTWVMSNVLAILVIVFSMYVSYRRIKKSGDDGDFPFSSHAFLGWDYSVTSPEGSKMLSTTIATHIKELLREEKVKRKWTTKERLRLWSIRVGCNLVSLAVLGASAYLIYFVADQSIKPGLDVPRVVNDFLEKYLLAVLVMSLKIFIPPLLSLLLILEKYHPRTQVKVQIARTGVFYVASLVIFLASVYSVSTQCLSASNTNKTDYCCWENEVGEQLFQVVILDLGTTLVFGLVFSAGRAAAVRLCHCKKIGYESFNVAEQILDLVYAQSLIWLGLYFAPFLAFAGFVKFAILFYFHYVLARTCRVPPDKVFKASRSGTFYLFILFLTLFVCLFPLTYAITQLEPSTSCGPFKYKYRVYEVLTDKIGDSPEWVQETFSYASTPGVVIPIILVLLLLILYYRAKSTVHSMEAKELRYMLQFERKVGKRNIFSRARLQHGLSAMSGLDT